METVLILSKCGFPPLSARQCKQRLWTVPLSMHQRTLDGRLILLGPAMTKYRTRIEGKGQDMVALGCEVGDVLEVQCIQTLWQVVEAGETVCEMRRDAVEGSVGWVDDEGAEPVKRVEGRKVFLPLQKSRRLLAYRPKLTMVLLRYEGVVDEWAFEQEWFMELEEV
jgi:hypothetical protein